MRATQEQRMFRADPLKLKRLRVTAGMSVQQFTNNVQLDRTTVGKILSGEPVFLATLALAVRRAFQIEDVLEILHPEELAAMGAMTTPVLHGQVLEWQIESHLSPWLSTANGLQYQVVRLQHRFLPHRDARGKCYELRHLATSERERIDGALRRHVEVCERVAASPHVATNLTAAVIDGLWWVLDRWLEGDTLEDRLRDGPLPDYSWAPTMLGIARGLLALHDAGVIRRELRPSFIILSKPHGVPVLTDLELSKILDGSVSVSPADWPQDPYRAIEVQGHAPVDARADLYSWGRIFVHVVTGTLPPTGQEEVSLRSVPLPEKVREIVKRCVAVPVADRPADFRVLLKILEKWR